MALAFTMVATTQALPRDSTFEDAYEAWRQSVYRWALRFTHGRAGPAEDLTHDVFLKLLEHLPRLEAKTELGGWLYRVTANLALSRLRRERSFTTRLASLFLEDDASDDTPDAGLALKEDAEAALAALRALPARESIVLTMKVIDGRSQREIAEALSMSEGYVSKLVTRGWERLREQGWEVADAAA